MSTALAVPTNGVPMASTGRVQLGGAMAMQQTIEDLDTIRKFVAGAMIKDVDYGVIPGTGSKATLYLPGAQKTLMYFNCYPEYTIEPRELDKGHVEYIVKTLLRSRSSQSPTGSGIGSCSTMESKYRWRKAGRVCPKCGAEAITKSKYDDGFFCFAKKDGCGAKFADNDPAITSQATGRSENPDIYDQRNTVLKMSKKRSLVDSALGLGCMSELFTQDLEDHAQAPDHDDRPSRDEPSRDREPAREPSREARPTQGGNGQGNAPRSGKGLFAWIKEQETAHDIGLLKYINAWAKLKDMPGRMVDWDMDAVNLAYAEAVRKIQSITSPPDSPLPAKDKPATQATGAEPDRAIWPDVAAEICDQANADWNAEMNLNDVQPRVRGEHRELVNKFQLTNHLCQHAIDKGAIKTEDVADIDPATGEAPWVPKKVWSEVGRLYSKIPGKVRQNAEAYIAEKRAEACRSLDIPTAPAALVSAN